MFRKSLLSIGCLALLLTTAAFCSAQQAPSSSLPFSVFVYDRTRVDNWQWFAAPPESETYSYVESLLRIGIAQHIQRWDLELELAQPAVLGLPATQFLQSRRKDN